MRSGSPRSQTKPKSRRRLSRGGNSRADTKWGWGHVSQHRGVTEETYMSGVSVDASASASRWSSDRSPCPLPGYVRCNAISHLTRALNGYVE
jgi:hypothetical protein